MIKKGILSNKKNELQSSLLDKVSDLMRNRVKNDTKDTFINTFIFFDFLQLNKVGIQTGLPAFMLQSKYVDSYYASFNAMPYNFYSTIQFGFGSIKEDMQRRLINPQEEFRYLSNFLHKSCDMI